MKTIDCEECCASGQRGAVDPRDAPRPCPECYGRGEVDVRPDPYADEEREPMSPLASALFEGALDFARGARWRA